MLRPLTSRNGPPATSRRGAILVVVLGLLALFAVVGISFVFYASSEADSARIHREGQSRADAGPPDGNEAVNAFVGSFIYDTGDTGTYLLNAMRGHSLAATMYGRRTP